MSKAFFERVWIGTYAHLCRLYAHSVHSLTDTHCTHSTRTHHLPDAHTRTHLETYRRATYTWLHYIEALPGTLTSHALTGTYRHRGNYIHTHSQALTALTFTYTHAHALTGTFTHTLTSTHKHSRALTRIYDELHTHALTGT